MKECLCRRNDVSLMYKVNAAMRLRGRSVLFCCLFNILLFSFYCLGTVDQRVVGIKILLRTLKFLSIINLQIMRLKEPPASVYK